MLYQFLIDHRSELIARCDAQAAERSISDSAHQATRYGVTVFLEQLIAALRVGSTPGLRSDPHAPVEAEIVWPAMSGIRQSAALHGRDMLRQGFALEDVVHDYGDLCQAIGDLASEHAVDLPIDDFRMLQRCVDQAIASAVAEFNYQQGFALAKKQAIELNERLGFLAHELRNQLCTATLALSIIKQNGANMSGSTAGILDRSLVGLGNLIDRSLAEVRMAVGMPVHNQRYSLADFIAELKLSASLEAEVKACVLTVHEVDASLAIDVDRDLLLAATGNLLQNAFKFSHPHSEITLQAYAAADRILIEVEDRCGGLPSNNAETLFQPFVQEGIDQSGLGLGLSISRRSVEANNGTLSVRNIPGSGCVFTISLPRYVMAATSSSAAES